MKRNTAKDILQLHKGVTRSARLHLNNSTYKKRRKSFVLAFQYYIMTVWTQPFSGIYCGQRGAMNRERL